MTTLVTFKRKITYALASVFVVWQTLGLVIGPAPGSHSMAHIYPIFKPYLSVLHQDNEWGFFAPDPAKGSILRYVIKDESQDEQVFKLTENLRRGDASFLRYTSLFLTIARNNEGYVNSAAQYLCKQHQDIKASEIKFFIGHQQAFSPTEYLNGNRPLDDKFIEVEYFPSISCDV